MFSVWIVLCCNSNNYHNKANPARNFEMAFGIVFQEYYLKVDKAAPLLISKLVRISWVICATFMTMALTGNLKSTLIRGRYEDRTMTINEIIDKDMTLHITDNMEDYLSLTESHLNNRMLCQARKKNSISPVNRTHAVVQMYQPVIDHGGASPSFAQNIEVVYNEFMKRGEELPVVMIPEVYTTMSQSMILQLTDPRVPYFNQVIDVAKDVGLIEHFFSKWTAVKNMKPPVDVHKEPLVMDHFYLPCMIGGCILTLAMLSFLIELSLKTNDKSLLG